MTEFDNVSIDIVEQASAALAASDRANRLASERARAEAKANKGRK